MGTPTTTRLLVVRVGAMGDVLHALPAVTALRRLRPELEIGWAVDRRWVPLVAGAAHRVHALDIGSWKQQPVSLSTLRLLRTLREELHAAAYSTAVDLQGTLRSAAIARLSGAGRRVGPVAPREQLARLAYTERVATPAASVVEQAGELLGAATGERLTPAPVQCAEDEAAERWADALVGTAPCALLAPTAGWGAKQWPAEHFAELARALGRRGLRVLVNAASEAEPLPRLVSEAAHSERTVCSVAQLVALTRRACLVVGGDTGPVHLAAALGRPTVALFGPTDPARNGPAFPGARVTVLRHPASVRSYKRTALPDAGLLRLTVPEVLAAADRLLEGGHG